MKNKPFIVKFLAHNEYEESTCKMNVNHAMKMIQPIENNVPSESDEGKSERDACANDRTAPKNAEKKTIANEKLNQSRKLKLTLRR